MLSISVFKFVKTKSDIKGTHFNVKVLFSRYVVISEF